MKKFTLMLALAAAAFVTQAAKAALVDANGNPITSSGGVVSTTPAEVAEVAPAPKAPVVKKKHAAHKKAVKAKAVKAKPAAAAPATTTAQ